MGHYWAKPDTEYRYVIRPLFRPATGDLSTLWRGTDLEITARTESEDIGQHSVFFYRRAIVSQAYAERFATDETVSSAELAAEFNDRDIGQNQFLSDHCPVFFEISY